MIDSRKFINDVNGILFKLGYTEKADFKNTDGNLILTYNRTGDTLVCVFKGNSVELSGVRTGHKENFNREDMGEMEYHVAVKTVARRIAAYRDPPKDELSWYARKQTDKARKKKDYKNT